MLTTSGQILAKFRGTDSRLSVKVVSGSKAGHARLRKYFSASINSSASLTSNVIFLTYRWLIEEYKYCGCNSQEFMVPIGAASYCMAILSADEEWLRDNILATIVALAQSGPYPNESALKSDPGGVASAIWALKIVPNVGIPKALDLSLAEELEHSLLGLSQSDEQWIEDGLILRQYLSKERAHIDD